MSVKKDDEIELEKEITCAICHEHYTDPKILPCLHYYCKQCIHTLALRTGIDKPFPCPECRTDTTLPQGGVDHLKPAFFINRMKSIHSNLSKVHGKVEAMCESCTGDKAEAFCRQCEEFICAECVKQHQRMKIFTGHKTVSLDELKKGGAKDIVVPKAPLKMCEKHDEQMKIYCFDCNCLICRDCIIKDHNGHNHEFIKEAAPKVKKELLEQLDPLKEVKVNLSQAVEEINITKSKVKDQVGIVTKEIKTSFNELRQFLANREQELLEETTAKGAQKLDLLSAQEKKLSTSHTVVKSVIEYTEQCLEHSADDEVMCVHVEMDRISKEVSAEVVMKDENCYHPVEKADIGFEISCMKDLKQICETQVKLTQLTAEVIKSAEVNKIDELYVTTELSKKPIISLKCHLRSLTTESLITECEVDRDEGCCLIQYTPTARGRHEITLTVNGQEIAGSPFPLFVSIHPTQQGTPVRDLDCSGSTLAVNSAEEVIMTDYYNVTVYSKDGLQKEQVYILRTYELYPHGVAVDSDNYIYVSCNRYAEHEIIKLTPALALVKRSGQIDTDCGQDDTVRFENMTVVGDELMVCAVDIFVFNRELELVRKVSANKGPKVETFRFMDVSSDRHGNLYACAHYDKELNNCSAIVVFAKSGRFLQIFDKVNGLARACGVCALGEYVYLTYNDKLSVYTTEGKVVTTIDLDNQRGICADKDGYIYTCGSDRVYVM